MKKVLIVVVLALAALTGALVGITAVQESRQLAVTPAEKIELDEGAVERLARSIRFRTVSHQDPSRFDGAPFRALHDFFRGAYPRSHADLTREVVNDHSLLYTWPGSAPELQPILLLAHLDVVPVEPGTEEVWQHDAFAGEVADGFIWGRGSLDDKVAALAMLEAAEHLLARGFKPRRTVLFAFGHDEEVGGREGAAAIAANLRERGVRAHFSLDEGLIITLGLMPGVEGPVALIGLAEKGYVSLELTARASGGHSSMPPARTATSVLAAALHALHENPAPASIGGAAAQMFAYVGPEMAPPLNLVFANRWLLEPVIEMQLAGQPATNALIRTTAATTIIEAGVKENVLPSEARAVVNFRILPGESITSVVDRVRATIDDEAVEVTARPGDEPSPVAEADSRSFATLHTTIREIFPETIVAPGLMVAGTDTKHYVDLADNSYRFLPIRLGPEDLKRIHGANERVAVDNYLDIIRFYARLIENAAG
jgi:carboxypeptidase PM20D1